MNKKIKNALISVFYKDGLEPLVKQLHSQGVNIYSTGGTQQFIEALGIPVIAVEALTDYPSILGGRVKTLHPKVFGGILARRENAEDMATLDQYKIPELDLVIVDLYPFEETLSKTQDESQIIEKIDIGGVSLIRAAAKNHKDTTIIANKEDYVALLNILQASNGEISLEERRSFAGKAFQTTQQYDALIASYFAGNKTYPLRYGENPHQSAVFKGNLEKVFTQLSGKELSYNNLNDIDAALGLLTEFDQPAFVIIKHTNPCGVALADTLAEAWKMALSSNPVSAFGGIIATNRPLDTATAAEINKLFFEVLIAPGFTPESETAFKTKNRIVLKLHEIPANDRQIKTLLNGTLEQDADNKTSTAEELNCVTKEKPTSAQVKAMLFAEKIVKHTKSNTIVLSNDKQLLGIGCGQTSRVNALKNAIADAHEFRMDLNGAVMASDAFFPFPDCVEIAGKEGIKAVLQPGGSVKDQLSIDYCDQHGMSMVFTGIRHFKH